MDDRSTEFKVSCDCGKSFSVSEGSAGAQLICDCGRIVTVPSLATLRIAAGLSAIPRNPVEIVQSMIAEGTLPPAECICCHFRGDEEIPFVAICEQEWSQGSRLHNLEWLLVSLLVPAVHLFKQPDANNEVLGRDVAVAMPIRLCPTCLDRLPSGRMARVVRTAKYLLVFSVVAVLFVSDWRWLAVPLIPLALSLHFIEWIMTAWHRSAIRKLVCVVPEYRDVFRRYPEAIVGQFSSESLNLKR